jgi:dynein heavy chain, axonemal
MNTVLF